MIDAVAYYPIYLFIVTIMSLSVYSRYSHRVYDTGLLNRRSRDNGGMFLLMLFLILFIGFRPQSKVFVDMMNYIENYHTFFENTPFEWNWLTDNLIFDNYLAFVGSQNLGTTFFFVTIAAVYFGCAYWGIRRLFPQDTAIAYLTFLGAFSTFSYGTNGIKAGAAASLFILALSYYRNWKVCIPLLIITLGFHHSMTMPIVAFVLSVLWKNPKHFFWGWFFSLCCAFAHVSFFQELFAGMTDESGAGYLTSGGEDWGGKSGFRLDFVLYSSMPVLVGYYAIYKHKIESRTYSILLKVYLTTNAIWMLCMYASFTNRIAYLSWLLYPIVLIYPFLNEEWGKNKYRIASKVFICHLAFTLFMQIIYYS